VSTALAPGMAPERVVPGDPAGPRALAARLDTYAEGADAAAARLRALEERTWVGEAAEAFRSGLDELPQRLERASSSFAEAASALRAYAAVLAEAKERAAVALEHYEDAEAESRAWESQRFDYEAALAAEAGGGPPAGPAPSRRDPGAVGRAGAERLAGDARDDVEAAARRAAERLERAGDDAPDKPGFWDSAFKAGGEFLGGLAEATVGLGEFAFKLTPVYALVDPNGYVENLVGLGKGVAYGLTHPVEFAQAVTNWDMWMENPARALGQLVPDLVLALGTAGAGTAATAASRVARGAERLDDVADGARAAERVARAGGAGRRVADDVEGLGPATRVQTPSVGSQRLQNIVEDLYKGTTNPNGVGTGTTADAIRYELRTGQRVFGRSHIQKGQDYLRGLENWLKANPTAPYRDRLVARSLADDLLDALGGIR
jgi:uncharacterized protein YukE